MTQLLSDEQMIGFVREGYLTIDAHLPAEFHTALHSQIRDLFEKDGNPGNDILPRVPDLHRVLEQPTVSGALTSLLGSDYLLHPHRHCHLNPAGSSGQQMHQDSYERDQNVRHHRARWLMAFYYPQDVDPDLGPSSIVPATQFLTWKSQHDSPHELPMVGKAGTVTIVHYDLWHRAMANVGERDRFMVKFLFTRMQEPTAATWAHDGRDWATAERDDDTVCSQAWDWMRGLTAPLGNHVESLEELIRRLSDEDEMRRYDAAYRLGRMGKTGVSALTAALRVESEDRLAANLERSHTNPAQLDAAYGLTTAGSAAVPALTSLLEEESWVLRASAADTLGDMGHAAASGADALARVLDDESAWVRRNAVEALGNIGPLAAAAAPALSKCLSDQDVTVRHNAALALAKMGAGETTLLTQASTDEDLYVRQLAAEALRRCHP
jgi:hypothetical protein